MSAAGGSAAGGGQDTTPGMTGVLHRNIHALVEVRRELDARKGRQDRIADAITHFTGSMPFVYLHALLFGGWLLLNSGLLPFVRPWDPFPFVMLAMWASVEAIFLSTFVLISQNRMAQLADKRAELDLQVSLLAEHEITRLVDLTDAIALHLGVREGRSEDLPELKQNVKPEQVLGEIERAEREPH
jgi:uncharacterized membrane protein